MKTAFRTIALVLLTVPFCSCGIDTSLNSSEQEVGLQTFRAEHSPHNVPKPVTNPITKRDQQANISTPEWTSPVPRVQTKHVQPIPSIQYDRHGNITTIGKPALNPNNPTLTLDPNAVDPDNRSEMMK